MTAPKTRLVAGVVLAGLACVVASCESGAGEPDWPTVSQHITRDFGRTALFDDGNLQIDQHPNALRALRAKHRVGLNPSAYVESIDGRRQRSGDDDTLWVLNINGIETDGPPEDLRLYPGDIVQWDLRDWYVFYDVRATVGAFPQPFTGGMLGRRFPVSTHCETPVSSVCERVKNVLRRAGVQLNRPPARRRSPGFIHEAKIFVGRWKRWRHAWWADNIEAGPRYSGIFAIPSSGGDQLNLLDWNGQRQRAIRAGGGLIGAVRPTEEDLIWLVTGVDHLGVDRASRALTSSTLRDAFAVAITDDGVERLPLPAQQR